MITKDQKDIHALKNVWGSLIKPVQGKHYYFKRMAVHCVSKLTMLIAGKINILYPRHKANKIQTKECFLIVAQIHPG